MARSQHKTEPKETRGWYLYDAANSAFFYGVLTFLPLLVLDEGRELAHRTVCMQEVPNSVPEERALTKSCLLAAEQSDWCRCMLKESNWEDVEGNEIPDHAMVTLFGSIEVNYSSIFARATGISVVIQIMVMFLFSSMADYGGYRHTLLKASNFIGGSACIVSGLFGSVFSNLLSVSMHVNLVCFVISSVFLNLALVMYSAYLPILAAGHPEVKALPDVGSQREEKEDEIEARISGRGIMVGQMGQFVFIGICIIFFRYEAPISFLVLFGGLWVLFLGTVAIQMISPRPASKLPAGNAVCSSVKDMCRTLCYLRALPQLGLFFVSYLIWSEGATTQYVLLSRLADETAKATEIESTLLMILVSLWMVVGINWALVARERKGAAMPKTILLFSLCVQGVLPLYMIMLSWGSSMDVNRAFIYASIFGLVTGPQRAFTRSIFAMLLPEGKEGAFFGLYQIADKGTSHLGPLLVTFVSGTQGFQYGYASLFAFYVVGIPLLCCFNRQKADDQKLEFDQAQLQEELNK